MKRTAAVLVLLMLAMSFAPGCLGRVISEGIEKTMGPTARTLPLEPKWPEGDGKFLAGYKNFELVLPVKTEFPDVPGEFMDCLPAKFDEQLASKDLPAHKAGKTLQISVTILAYQPAGSFEKAMGPTEEAVARVELLDKDSGKVVGRAICIGRTYQTVGLGPQWKAWGLCRAIVNKWINEYYPKEGRKEAEEKAPPGSGQ